MHKKVTLKTIARDLNLSPGTVSRVLNGKAKEFRISDETVAKVFEFVKQKNYSPNLIAKGLQASKTFTIGLMIPDISNPFFALMAKYIQRAALKANYSILLVDAEEDIEREKRQIKNMVSRKVDGIIAAPVGTVFDHFQDIIAEGIPLVFIDRYFKNADVPYISSNNYNGAYEATKLLIENGHKRIALIKGDEVIEPVKERREGFLNALAEFGVSQAKCWVVGNEFTIENGYLHAIQLLESDEKPTAIFAMSNLIGLGVLKAVKENKLKIPDDISLIIFDDQPYVSYIDPPITTVKQNSEKIGELAIEFIIKKIDNGSTELASQLIATNIMVRNSVKNIN